MKFILFALLLSLPACAQPQDSTEQAHIKERLDQVNHLYRAGGDIQESVLLGLLASGVYVAGGLVLSAGENNRVPGYWLMGAGVVFNAISIIQLFNAGLELQRSGKASE
jgi:hypothetical protein